MKKETARRWKYGVALTAVTVAAGVVQVEFFGRLGLWAVPDLVFAALMCVAFYCGKETGAVMGLCAGVLVEALERAPGLHFLPVVYLLCGYVCGAAVRGRFTERSFLNYLCVVGAAIPVHEGIELAKIATRYGNIRVEHLVTRVLLPDAAALVLSMVVLYLPLRQLCRWLKSPPYGWFE